MTDIPKSLLVAGYDDVSSGRNINLTYHYAVNQKWNVYGGIKYMLNSQQYRNVHNVATPYFKEMYADGAGQHLGLKIGVERNIWIPNDAFQLSVFYDLQRTKATVKSQNKYWFSDTNYEEDGGSHSLRSLEHTLGLSAAIRINSRISFLAQAGIGYNAFKIDKEHKWALSDMDGIYAAFTRTYRFALAYKLQSDKRQDMSIPATTPARQAIALAMDDIQTGRTINAAYRRSLNTHHTIYFGLKVQINSRFFDDHTRMGESYYHKQFRAEGLAQHLGLKAGYTYGKSIPRSNLYVYGFYEVQASRAVVRNLAQLEQFSSGISRASNTSPMGYIGSVFYKDPIVNRNAGPSYRYYGPVTAIENYVGIGTLMNIAPKLKCRIQAGIGYNIYSGTEHYDPYYVHYQSGTFQYHENETFNAPNSEVSKMFSFGLEYTLDQ